MKKILAILTALILALGAACACAGADTDAAETPGDALGTVDFMKPALHYYSEPYAAAATEQVASLGGEADFFSLFDRAAEAYDALEETYAQPEAA